MFMFPFCERLDYLQKPRSGVSDVFIDIAKSFHCGMKVRVRVDRPRTLLDEIEVTNSLYLHIYIRTMVKHCSIFMAMLSLRGAHG